MPAPRKQKSKSAKKGAPKTRCTKMKQLTPGEWFEKLVAVQARLRAPEGCPWDREQTHQSLRTYLLEEAYEVLEALDKGNDAKFAEEMGDRKSTRLNSSHPSISYAVFCLKKKNKLLKTDAD